MNHRQTDDSESRFAGYVEGLASVIGHKDRIGPLRDYCRGLMLPCVRWACAAGLPRAVVLLDAGYGNNSALRADMTALDLTYVAGIQSTTTVWSPGTAPLAPKRWLGRGRPTTRLRRDARHQPVSVKQLAFGLSKRVAALSLA